MQRSYWLERGYSFYIGRLGGSDTPSDDIWYDEINFAERLLINIHRSSFNLLNINHLLEHTYGIVIVQ